MFEKQFVLIKNKLNDKVGEAYIRFFERKNYEYVFNNGKIKNFEFSENTGIGLESCKVLSSTSKMSNSGIDECVTSLLKGIKTSKCKDSSQFKNKDYRQKLEFNNIDFNKLIETCKEASKILENKNIKKSHIKLKLSIQHKRIEDLSGSIIESRDFNFFGTLFVLSKLKIPIRDNFGVQNQRFNFSSIMEKSENLIRISGMNGKRIRGKFKIICDGELGSIICHELIGHPLEGDNFINKKGRWLYEYLMKFGLNDKLTVVDNSFAKNGIVKHKYDDECNIAKKVTLIKDGKFNNFLHNNWTAKLSNMENFGCARVYSYEFFPLPRMRNTYIEPMNISLDEMLNEVKNGVYLKGCNLSTTDSYHKEFLINVREGFTIENGCIKDSIKNPRLVGSSLDFLCNIDGIANDLSFMPVLCGKGNPNQTILVGNGSPHINSYGKLI